MISAVARNSSQHVRKEEQTQAPDALTAKRLAESRQLAIAAVNQQQRARMQEAVTSYMSLTVSTPSDGTPKNVPLAQAQRAYSNFERSIARRPRRKLRISAGCWPCQLQRDQVIAVNR